MIIFRRKFSNSVGYHKEAAPEVNLKIHILLKRKFIGEAASVGGNLKKPLPSSIFTVIACVFPDIISLQEHIKVATIDDILKFR